MPAFHLNDGQQNPLARTAGSFRVQPAAVNLPSPLVGRDLSSAGASSDCSAMRKPRWENSRR